MRRERRAVEPQPLGPLIGREDGAAGRVHAAAAAEIGLGVAIAADDAGTEAQVLRDFGHQPHRAVQAPVAAAVAGADRPHRISRPQRRDRQRRPVVWIGGGELRRRCDGNGVGGGEQRPAQGIHRHAPALPGRCGAGIQRHGQILRRGEACLRIIVRAGVQFCDVAIRFAVLVQTKANDDRAIGTDAGRITQLPASQIDTFSPRNSDSAFIPVACVQINARYAG